MSLEAQISDFEDRRVKALIEADTDQIEKLFRDDLHWTHSSGSTDTKAGVIEKLQGGVIRYFSIDRSETEVCIFGDTALCRGQMTMHCEVAGTEHHLKSRYSNLWVAGDAGWQMVHWQSTGVAH